MRARLPASSPRNVEKAATGIPGFDEITSGGLRRGSTTLLEGGPGSGKTVMALQSLVNGAKLYGEPGIFVAFEESTERILANAATFGWNLAALQRRKLQFLDVQPTVDFIRSGGFDLSGLLAMLNAQLERMPARRIVFDGLDVVLSLLDDRTSERREVLRLHEWLLERQLTAIITSKSGQYFSADPAEQTSGYIEFMVDCSILLSHEVYQGTLQRNLRIRKYRGSTFSENEAPYVISSEGFYVSAPSDSVRAQMPAASERLSTGIERLDTMLEGGYYRGTSILITGSPGTAKSTLACAFVEAACLRGERTTLVSFESDGHELARNMNSVRIRLARFVNSGLLQIMTARVLATSAEASVLKIRRAAQAHGARCLVVDPISALASWGNENVGFPVAVTMLDWAKAEGITLLCTSLLTQASEEAQARLPVSTIADTWIHLSYLVRAGERNRGLSIVKSRGTAHSNQVRELILARQGVTLRDVYSSGGEVLMGTMRHEREREDQLSLDHMQQELLHRHAHLELEEEELEARLDGIRRELRSKRMEKANLVASTRREAAEGRAESRRRQQLRFADPVKNQAKRS